MRAIPIAATLLAAASLAVGCGSDERDQAPGAGDSAPGGVPRTFWGVVSGTELSPEELDMMGDADVGTLRQLVLWPQIEPSDDEYDWTTLDPIVAEAAENGIEMLPFVYGTPSWAVGDCLGLEPLVCQRIPPLSSEDAKHAWQDFLHDLVSRYGPDGSFWSDDSDVFDPPKLPITRWQIWNEPSSPSFYQPKPSPQGYGELVKLSHDAITEVDPDAEIVLAGLFRTPQKGQAEEGGPSEFLRELYAVEGIEDDFDAIALHPYATNLNQITTLFDQVLPTMREAGDADKPIWITELGWSSAPPEPNKPLLKGVEGQAKLLTDSFELLRSKREQWNLEGVVWYQWKDLAEPVEGCTFCQLSGLLDGDGEPKPAWDAFNEFTGGDSG
ncbi:MAG TPA: glycosyl hydrolase [Solirubrobacterales bacterium]|nr:glycosyl hydrolase [Solirubrobacterales bacterium]